MTTLQENQHDILNNLMIEVDLKSSFKVVKEVLTRFGIANRLSKELTQTVHIFKKNDRYYLCHFKMMFGMDGRTIDMADKDWDRFFRIALMMEEFNHVTIKHNWQRDECATHNCEKKDIFCIRKIDVPEWTLRQKITFGKK